MGQHTPGPISIFRHDPHSEWFGNITGHYGKNERGIEEIRTIACLTRYGTPEEQEANAQRLERAWNCHDDLLGALQECQTVLAMLTEPEAIRSTTVYHAWGQAVAAEAKARAALSKALGDTNK